MANYVEGFSSKLDWAMPFQRTGEFPLDRTDLFSSYADAVKYAAGNADDPDSRELCGTSYVGQIIAVYENSVVTVYKIEEDRSLGEVGSSTNGDGSSIILDEGALKLYGFDSATAGQQLRVYNAGTEEAPDLKLQWFTPDNSNIDDLITAVDALETTVGDADSGLVKDVADLQTTKANAADVYTKTEIDSKLTSAIHYKGTYETFETLTTTVTDPAIGDVYNITTAGGTDANGVAIKAGDNVIYNGTGWDCQSGTVDLSAYATTEQVNTSLADKVDKVTGSRLITEAEATRLGEVSKVTASTTNGKIVIDDVETDVYKLPIATNTTIGGVKSAKSDSTYGITVNAETGAMSVIGIPGAVVKSAVAEAEKVSHTLTIGESGKTFDGSADVTLTAADIPMPSNLAKTDVYGTDTTAGTVKSSDEQDKIAIETDGTMSVNTISPSKINGSVASANKVDNTLTIGESGKTFDGSANVLITAADIGAVVFTDIDDVVRTSDIATTTDLGIVKGSADQDKISVGTDGTMSVNTISGSKIASAVATATNAQQLAGVAGTEVLIADGDNLTAKVKSAAKADQLATARNIELTGDITGNVDFDGTADVDISTALTNTGVTAGTYTKVTVDAKGRATAGSTLVASDIPDLTMSKITDAGDLATKDKVSATDLDTALAGRITTLEGGSHTHSNKTVIDGITSAKVTSWDTAADAISTKANKSTTIAGYGITDAYTKTEIDGKVAGAYHYKGTYATFTALVAAVTAGDITPSAGDVYNITTGSTTETDRSGVAIKSGDNVVYASDSPAGWDVLGGTVDLSAYATTEFVNTELTSKANQTQVDDVSDRVDVLEDAVGTVDYGLIKAAADLRIDVTLNSTDIDALQTTVGDSTSGLVKDVEDLKTVTTKLDGEETVTGSVRNLIAASSTTLTEAINNITKTDGTIDTKIATHNTDTNAHSTLFAAKQNKAIISTINMPVSEFDDNTDDTDPPIVGTHTVVGLDPTKDYVANVSPTIGSCATVAAAQFYPVTEVTAGVLKVYCTNTPTAAISLACTFIEVQ